MNKLWEVKKRILYIYPTPTKDIPNGLKLTFLPSQYWMKKYGKSLEPMITTKIYKDVNEYQLPARFKANKIISIDF